MINPEVRTLHEADGTPVCNVSLDLSAGQLGAAAKVVDAVRLARHRGEALSTDDVLALRELTSVSDELHRLAEHGAHGTLVLPLARFLALHDALGEWIHHADERGWLREAERGAHAFVDPLLDPMTQLRTEALHA